MSEHTKSHVKYKRFLSAMIMLLSLTGVTVLATACKDSIDIVETEPSSIPLPTAEPTATPVPTATPIPTPTPVVDVPNDRYDAQSEGRAAEDELPEIYYVEAIDGILNPLYCESETDRQITDMTQIRLLDTDEEGNAVAGVDRPCLAYSIEQLEDNSMFAGGIDGLPQNWKAYRIALKEGITFADGTPVTAGDVMFTVKKLADLEYEGPSRLSDLNILAMNEFHTRVSNETRVIASECVSAGINADGTMPEEFDDAENWAAVWDCLDEAGTRMAQDIIDHVNSEYNMDAYVQMFLSTNTTYSYVNTSDNLKTVYAMVVWGYLKRQNYSFSQNKIRDYRNELHDLNVETFDAAKFWEMIKEYHGYNLSSADGISYESAIEGKHIEDYIAEVYCERNMQDIELEGVQIYSKEYEDGAVRRTIDVLIDESENIADFNFYIAEKAFYEGNEHSNELHGAGKYALKSMETFEVTADGSEDGEEAAKEYTRIELVANDSYMLGSPLKKYITFTTEPEPEEEAGDEPVENAENAASGNNAEGE